MFLPARAQTGRIRVEPLGGAKPEWFAIEGAAPIFLTKANSRATVHRPGYLDYVGVKRTSPDGKVIGELQKGYKLGDRVLRPSMVRVGKG